MTPSIWVVVTGPEDAVIEEAHRLADLLEETGDRPSVVAIGFDGLSERVFEDIPPDEVLRLAAETGSFGSGAASLEARLEALVWLADRRIPRAVLTSSTPDGDDLVARLAPRLDGGCVTDCLLRVRDGDLIAGRVVYEDRAYAEFAFESGPPVVSIDTTVLDTPPSREPAQPTTTRHTVPVDADERSVQRLETLDIPEQDLSRARTIVAGGQGLGGSEGFETIRKLADAIGGTVGASRPPADNGWIEYDRQIGVTGKDISPVLYVPCAISGDPYHTRSVNAEHVIPINTDPDARIFEFADIGVVGDVFEYGPALASAIRAATENPANRPGSERDVQDHD